MPDGAVMSTGETALAKAAGRTVLVLIPETAIYRLKNDLRQ